MKVRSGFVSNSSSSSFIIVGVEKNFEIDEVKSILKNVYDCNDEYDEDSEYYDTLRDKIQEDGDFVIGFDFNYIGMLLSSGDDELESFSYDLQELIDMANKVSDKFGFDINDVKLIGGTEYN